MDLGHGYLRFEGMAPTRDRVRQHRRRFRRQGLGPVQIWIPDEWTPAFVAEAHRRSATIAAGEQESDDQAFVDAIFCEYDAGAEA